MYSMLGKERIFKKITSRLQTSLIQLSLSRYIYVSGWFSKVRKGSKFQTFHPQSVSHAVLYFYTIKISRSEILNSLLLFFPKLSSYVSNCQEYCQWQISMIKMNTLIIFHKKTDEIQEPGVIIRQEWQHMQYKALLQKHLTNNQEERV